MDQCIKSLTAIFVLLIGLPHVRPSIEIVNDSKLVHLLTSENNVVVLFTKTNCQDCDKLEVILEDIQNDLKANIGVVVVKAYNNHMVNLYAPSKEPALIFFRRGVPLLYYGELSGGEILEYFNENREPVVRELSDENFEHLTQSASGATTGDWFVFFYSQECVFCLRFLATWEAIGARLKHRLNIARIDRLGAGFQTAKRFGVLRSPEFIFIRQGKFYKYKDKEYTVDELIESAVSGFVKQGNPVIVPPVNNTLNTFLVNYIMGLIKNPHFVMLTSAVILTIIVFGCFLCRGFRAQKPITAKKVE